MYGQEVIKGKGQLGLPLAPTPHDYSLAEGAKAFHPHKKSTCLKFLVPSENGDFGLCQSGAKRAFSQMVVRGKREGRGRKHSLRQNMDAL